MEWATLQNYKEHYIQEREMQERLAEKYGYKKKDAGQGKPKIGDEHKVSPNVDARSEEYLRDGQNLAESQYYGDADQRREYPESRNGAVANPQRYQQQASDHSRHQEELYAQHLEHQNRKLRESQDERSPGKHFDHQSNEEFERRRLQQDYDQSIAGGYADQRSNHSVRPDQISQNKSPNGCQTNGESDQRKQAEQKYQGKQQQRTPTDYQEARGQYQLQNGAPQRVGQEFRAQQQGGAAPSHVLSPQGQKPQNHQDTNPQRGYKGTSHNQELQKSPQKQGYDTKAAQEQAFQQQQPQSSPYNQQRPQDQYNNQARSRQGQQNDALDSLQSHVDQRTTSNHIYGQGIIRGPNSRQGVQEDQNVRRSQAYEANQPNTYGQARGNVLSQSAVFSQKE